MTTDRKNNEEKLSLLGEGPIDPEQEEITPTSQLERVRERMMVTTEDDMPFPRAEGGTGWWLLAAAVLLALAIPIFYLALGVGGGVLSNTAWGWFVGVAILAFLGVSALTVWVYQVRASRRGLRDDFGNRVGQAMGSDEDADRFELFGGPGILRPGLDVRAVMRPDPIICGYLDSLTECARIMYEANVGFLVVLDAQDRCVGVVTDRDLVCGGLAESLDPASTPVTLVMEREVTSVTPDQSLDDCLKLMQNEGLRRIPVFESGRLAGIVALDDLIIRRRIAIEDAALVLRRQLAEPMLRIRKAG